MRTRRRRSSQHLGLLLAGSLAACSAAPKPALPGAGAPALADPSVLVGEVSREQVEAAVSDWVQAEVESVPDTEAARALATVPPGAEVTIYLGTWCGDSRRELSRLWKAFDAAGLSQGSLPFVLDYIGVDPAKQEPARLLLGSGLQYVPTVVVRRDGHEVGRIVESAPGGIERDLLSLLDGSAQGLISGRSELFHESPN
jgi:hypothetical protein